MSRPWRIEYEGALYHLLSRGNKRSDIFMNDKDRHSFLDAVGRMSERFDIDIFTYVLMSNHYSSFDNHNSFRRRVLICNYRKPINH
jgi:REP element-mobilizing transposase RayT